MLTGFDGEYEEGAFAPTTETPLAKPVGVIFVLFRLRRGLLSRLANLYESLFFVDYRFSFISSSGYFLRISEIIMGTVA
jgi:hypothetical protein